jgi:hypothetical protein
VVESLIVDIFLQFIAEIPPKMPSPGCQLSAEPQPGPGVLCPRKKGTAGFIQVIEGG